MWDQSDFYLSEKCFCMLFNFCIILVSVGVESSLLEATEVASGDIDKPVESLESNISSRLMSSPLCNYSH